jgi:RNA polymerase sigma-70 factor (ECF subfamily)
LGAGAAIAALHERFAPMVHGVLLARLAPTDADDLVQDVFVRVLEKLPSLRDAAAFPGWLAAMTRNFAAGFLRAAQHREWRGRAPGPRAAAQDRIDPAPPPHLAAEAHEVLAAIRALPEAYAETLALRLVEGLTGPEIAARTGLTHGSVRVNLHRGIAMLREKLKVNHE